MLTPKDIKIINTLKKNCRISTREISEKIGIPITTIHNRIKKLEEDGVIKSYRAVIDNRKIGKNIQAFVQISVHYGPHFSQEQCARKIFAMPEVDECYIMTGSTDILIKASTHDVDELNDFITNRLRNFRGVTKTVTSVVLKDIEETEKPFLMKTK